MKFTLQACWQSRALPVSLLQLPVLPIRHFFLKESLAASGYRHCGWAAFMFNRTLYGIVVSEWSYRSEEIDRLVKEHGCLSPVEQQVVDLTVSAENGANAPSIRRRAEHRCYFHPYRRRM